MSRSALAAVLVLMASMSPAQVRRPAFGTVVDSTGKPQEGAAVTFVWSPMFAGEPDVVRTITDARGRFRVDLQIGRGYSAFAIAGNLATEVHDALAVGCVHELVADRVASERRVQLRGNEAWTGDGPTVVHFHADARHAMYVALTADRGGVVSVPKGPFVSGCFELLDASGQVVDSRPLTAGSSEPVTFREPLELALTVVDTTGAPIAGAEVERQVCPPVQRIGFLLESAAIGQIQPLPVTVGNHWSHAGTTAAGGQVVVRIADIPSRQVGWIRVSGNKTCTGYASADSAMPSTHGPDELEIVLQSRPTGASEIRGANAVQAAHVVTTARHSKRNHSIRIGLPLNREDDTLEFADEPQNHVLHWGVLELAAEGSMLPRIAIVDSLALDKDELSIDELRRFRIRASDPAGNPLPGSAVTIVPILDDSSPAAQSLANLFLGPNGTGDVLLPDGPWMLYVRKGPLHVLHFVDPDAAGTDLDLHPVPFPTMRIRVTDENGKPVRNARPEKHGASGFSGVLRGAVGHTRESIASQIALPIALEQRSDADGILSLPVQTWRPMQVGLRIRAGDRRSAGFVLRAGSGDLLEITVR